MPKYRVYMSSTAWVEGLVEVEAASGDDAREVAQDRLGDVEWQYNGLVDETVSVNDVEALDVPED